MRLEANEISFQYNNGNRRILNRFSLAVESGMRIGVMAPSGFGKTTLCKILAGYEQPDTGQVILDGKPLVDYRGCLPVQLIWQHPEQSVNPRWRMRRVLEEGRIDRDDRIDDGLVSRLGIRGEWMERFPSELSGGELQRFCIARALLSGAKILLADEITTMLDLVTQSGIWHVLLEEAKLGNLGLLVVSHSEALLGKVCDQIIRLEVENGYKGNA